MYNKYAIPVVNTA